jgi:hypothetical protein
MKHCEFLAAAASKLNAKGHDILWRSLDGARHIRGASRLALSAVRDRRSSGPASSRTSVITAASSGKESVSETSARDPAARVGCARRRASRPRRGSQISRCTPRGCTSPNLATRRRAVAERPSPVYDLQNSVPASVRFRAKTAFRSQESEEAITKTLAGDVVCPAGPF